MAENWYKTLNSKSPLTQGDIFFKCPVITPEYKVLEDLKEEEPELKATVDEYDVIILSQSCDLENDKLKIVLVSPIFTLTEFAEFAPEFAGKKKKEKLRQGDFPPYHLLDKPNSKFFPNDYFVVDFHSVYGIPLPYLKELQTKQKRRLTLKSPYKEHLSQSFARYLMRVGLPSSILHLFKS